MKSHTKGISLFVAVLAVSAFVWFLVHHDFQDNAGQTSGLHESALSQPSGTEVKPTRDEEDEEVVSDAEGPEQARNASDQRGQPTNDPSRVWRENDVAVPVSTYVSELMKAVERGEPAAQHHLSYMVRFCSNLPPNESELAAQIEDIADAAVRQSTIEKFIVCEGLPQNIPYTEVRDYIMAAARAGHVPAKLEFQDHAFTVFSPENALRNAETIADLKLESLQHLNDAQSMGDAEALLKLALVWHDDFLIERDPVEAYAYMYAYREVRSDFEPTLLYMLESELSSEELTRATTKGETYAKCCD